MSCMSLVETKSSDPLEIALKHILEYQKEEIRHQKLSSFADYNLTLYLPTIIYPDLQYL